MVLGPFTFLLEAPALPGAFVLFCFKPHLVGLRVVEPKSKIPPSFPFTKEGTIPLSIKGQGRFYSWIVVMMKREPKWEKDFGPRKASGKQPE